MTVVSIKNLNKEYKNFQLKNVSFDIEEGKIVGFIGRNGAGKSTTMKSMLNFVHPTSGEVDFFGKNFLDNELEIKSKIGFVSGAVNYYPTKKLKKIIKTTAKFYDEWDDESCKYYMEFFNLDENKTPKELSEGMKVKFALVLALSHNAKFLMLDEPTSGLDPVSRDEILDIFLSLSEKGITILFSTHITSDLEKCADDIVYIKKGEIIENGNIDEFIQNYRIVEFEDGQIDKDLEPKLIGLKKNKRNSSALIKAEDSKNIAGNVIATDLESIMVHMEKED